MPWHTVQKSRSGPALEDRQRDTTAERTLGRLPNSCRLQGKSLWRVLWPHKRLPVFARLPGIDRPTNQWHQAPPCFVTAPQLLPAVFLLGQRLPLGGSGDCRLLLSPGSEVPSPWVWLWSPICSGLLLLDAMSERQAHLGSCLSQSPPPRSSKQ